MCGKSHKTQFNQSMDMLTSATSLHLLKAFQADVILLELEDIILEQMYCSISFRFYMNLNPSISDILYRV